MSFYFNCTTLYTQSNHSPPKTVTFISDGASNQINHDDDEDKNNDIRYQNIRKDTSSSSSSSLPIHPFIQFNPSLPLPVDYSVPPPPRTQPSPRH